MNRVNSGVADIFALSICAGFFLKLIPSDAFMGIAGA